MKFWTSLSLAALAVTMLPALAGAQSTAPPTSKKPESTVLTPEVKAKVLADVNTIIEKYAFVPGVDFTKWPSYLDNNKEAIEKATNPNQFAMAVNAALAKFGISHVVFNTPEGYSQIVTRKFVGLGIVPKLVPDGIMVVDVYPGSAAAEAKFAPGDIVIEADGKKPTTLTALRGELNTKIKVKLKRVAGTVDEITLTRREFSTVMPEGLKWATPDVAVLRVPSFMTYNYKNVDTLMQQAQKSKALIVDLRSNGGGQVVSLLQLLGYFIPREQAVGVFIDRTLAESYVKEGKGTEKDLVGMAKFALDGNRRQLARPMVMKDVTQYKGQVVVLINGGTGSASEIFAAAAMELRDAIVIGTKSAGAVLASTMRPISNGYMVQFPFQDYVTFKGLRLEENGVTPTIEVKAMPDGDPSNPDPGVEAALDALKRRDVIAK